MIKTKKLGEIDKRQEEIIEKSTVISEYKEKNRRLMRTPDGVTFITQIESKPRPSTYGFAVMKEGEASAEEIEEAKEIILDYLCDCIRNVAKRKPDEFFIIKNPDEMSGKKTVGAKFILPTVLEDEESIG